MPHAIRLDRQGNVWTTDARSSDIRKFSPEGKLLMTIAGSPPADCATRNFCGVTDLAFGPNGHAVAADGYSNARVIEYAADGSKVREWGSKGTDPGQFSLPHSIAVDDNGIVYVADRENRRVQRFDASGRFLGAWPLEGRPFSLELAGDTMWIGIGRTSPAGVVQPTLAEVDVATGRVRGWAIVPGGRGISMGPRGEILMDVGAAVFRLATDLAPFGR